MTAPARPATAGDQWDRGELIARMDELLIAVEDGRPLPTSALDNLPPWRAVLVARVADKAGAVLQQGTLAELRAAARLATGSAGPGWWTAALSR